MKVKDYNLKQHNATTFRDRPRTAAAATHTHTLAQTHARTHARTRTHTHTHTHTHRVKSAFVKTRMTRYTKNTTQKCVYIYIDIYIIN